MYDMSETFYTEKNLILAYDNRIFDSILELKYILSIEATHAWLKDGLDIYFDLPSHETGIKTPFKKYTPDFLVRNWQTGKAELVEIKPDGYDNIQSLQKRTQIANHHINEFGYDWQYKIIFGSHIHLSDHQYSKLSQVLQLRKKQCGLPYCFDLPPSTAPANYSLEHYRCFVINGVSPAFVP